MAIGSTPYPRSILPDSHHLWLWDPRFDGIGSSADTAYLGVANLGFEDWFAPFNGSRVIHPYLDDAPAEPGEDDDIDDT